MANVDANRGEIFFFKFVINKAADQAGFAHAEGAEHADFFSNQDLLFHDGHLSFNTSNSTLRFFARPSSVLFDATG